MPVTITQTMFANAVGLGHDINAANRAFPTVVATVERYAPDAPDAVLNEAAVRFGGWLAEAPASGARSESTGDISTSFSPAMTGGFRASGAMALLSPWKVRRAGAIG